MSKFQKIYLQAAASQLAGEDAALHWKKAKDEFRDALFWFAVGISLLLWWRALKNKDMPHGVLDGLHLDRRANLVLDDEMAFYNLMRAQGKTAVDIGLVALRRARRLETMNSDFVAAETRSILLTIPAIGEKFPFMLYRSHHDDRVRMTHLQNNGTVFSRTWQYAEKLIPPCGFNCRCEARPISLDYAKRLQKIPSKDGIVWASQTAHDNFYRGLFPDPGF